MGTVAYVGPPEGDAVDEGRRAPAPATGRLVAPQVLACTIDFVDPACLCKPCCHTGIGFNMAGICPLPDGAAKQ